MKKNKIAFGTLAMAMALVLGLALSGCADPTKDDGAANQQAADGFKSSYSTALALTVDTVSVTNKAAVQEALTAYTGLGDAVKALLPADTGAKLQVLLVKIAALEGAAGITYTATADGASSVTTSTSIALAFSAAVADLTDSDVTLTDGTGSATKGALSGGGTAWSLALSSVAIQGTVSVSIGKSGVESAAKTVAVYKAGAPADITYTAVANGAVNTTTSTSIAFTFSAAVAGLTADDISVANGTGAAMKGLLSGGGTAWAIALSSVATQGDVSVSIAKTGVESAAKTVAVYLAGAFVAVTDITDVPGAATAGTDLALSGTVAPANATNQTIVWSVADAGTTGASVSGTTLHTTAAGTAKVRATIANGSSASSNYTQDFDVAVASGGGGALGGTVTISGTAEVRQTLSAVTTGLTGQSGVLHYQWKAGGGNVGADAATYTITAADVGKTITVTVTASGSTGSVTGGPTEAVPEPAPGVTVNGLNAYLAGLTAGSPSSPHTVSMDWSIVINTSAVSGGAWAAINNTVQTRGVYVILDLSACTATGNTVAGEDEPSLNKMNIIQNNQYIKGIILPGTLTSIGTSAFYECTSLASVTIPNGVTSIGERAFYDCTSLASVTIPSRVTSIGEWAFYNCTSLASVTISAGVTGIGDRAFWGCTSLASVTIPGSVASIGLGAFYQCTGLTSVTIQNGVVSIGLGAFEGCTSLASVTIPGSVTSIEERAFSLCTHLASITVDATNTTFSSNGGVLFNKAKTTLLCYPAGHGASYTIPSGVTSIEAEAFRGCTGLTSVTIQNGVVSIGLGAFYQCTGLASVTIPSSVTSIGTEAFRGCTGLASATIPGSVASIGESAFYQCTDLTSVTIQNGVVSIGRGAFYQCTNLASVTIPSSVTSIGGSAFSYCTHLENVTIPGSVISIGGAAFSSCIVLVSVTIPGSVISIGDNAFYYCTRLTSVTFGAGSNIASGNFGSGAFPQGDYGNGDGLKTLYLAQTADAKAGAYRRASYSSGAWTKD
jgi:hypothetical protein